MKMNVFLLIVSLLFTGCSEKNDEEVMLPANLKVTTQVTGAQVNVTATAEKANYYTVLFTTSATPVTTKDGKASYTYTESGSYTITVRAHATQKDFIATTVTVQVDIIQGPVVNEGYTTPENYNGYTLVWQDEFNGSNVNAANWTFETGTGYNGWGNNELQYYRQENTTVSDGFLTITARKESFGGQNYTSSRLITKGKQEFKYGRADIRAKLPKGQGIWPAVWMLGANNSTVPWPGCGEIDIMEMIGGQGREKTVYGTLHWDQNGHVCTCDKPGKTLSSGTFADKFHVFTLIWDPNAIKFYVDDELFNTIDITPAALSEFHEKYFFIFDVAVGGNWPGSPDATTTFPQQMIVDYIRMFQAQ